MEITEKKIVDAAIRVFNDDLSASLALVAEEASVTRRTLNRYFNDRTKLFEACKSEMQIVCEAAMTTAYHSSADPVRQLEMMLYAGIDCNYKYAFLNKLYQRSTSISLDSQTDYLNIKQKWFMLISALQEEKRINQALTLNWIFIFFGGIIDTTIHALKAGDITQEDIKRFAWWSFSGGLGIR